MEIVTGACVTSLMHFRYIAGVTPSAGSSMKEREGFAGLLARLDGLVVGLRLMNLQVVIDPGSEA